MPRRAVAQNVWRISSPTLLGVPQYFVTVSNPVAPLDTSFARGKYLVLVRLVPHSETRVLSVAIYDYVENLQFAQAHVLSGGLLVFSFLVILALTLLEKRAGRLRI